MSTEINITVGPQSLKDRNRREVDANRFRLSEQEAQKRTEAAARESRQSALPQPVQRSGGTQSSFIRDKPAAWRRPVSPLGHIWADNLRVSFSEPSGFAENEWINNLSFSFVENVLLPYALNEFSANTNVVNSYGNVTGFLISGNGLLSVPVSSVANAERTTGNGNNLIILPVVKDTFIIITLDWYYFNQLARLYKYGTIITSEQGGPGLTTEEADLPPLFSSAWVISNVQQSTGGFVTSRAFVCNQRKIRQINIPTALNPLLQILNPPLSTITFNITTYPYTLRYEERFPPSYRVPDRSRPETVVVTETIRASAGVGPLSGSGTVAVFKALNELAVSNNLSPPINPSLIKEFPNSSIEVDSENSEFTSTINKIAYKQGNTPLPRLSYRYLSSTEFPDSTGIARFLGNSWDAGKSAYCRAMCKALGFTDADLTP